ncbi:MAG: GNAT family N-acetyltransferase [Anaerolineae bacterium]|nr:GNAT family N-acetyltransferase [Anaerolineae bacterium]
MNDLVTIKEIQEDPLRIATLCYLPVPGDGRDKTLVTFRPLLARDARRLGQYFLGLSDETRRRYGPHPFDQATADMLCAELNYAQTLRMLATLDLEEAEQVIAYFILVLGVLERDAARYARLAIPLAPDTDCTLAPSVADAFQSRGLGSLMMEHLIRVAVRLGRKRMVLMGGTQATNARAIHFYQKHGFRKVGEFEKPPGFNNYDMILEF